MLTETPHIDRYDQAILRAVAQDGRITVTALAEIVGLSKTPCHLRLKRLEAEGYIQGYRALLDPIKLGLDHVAFVEIKLSDTRAPALAAFNKAVRGMPEIEQCHMIAGAFDYLLKVRCRDMRAYRDFLGTQLSSLPHVAHTSTHVAMESVKENSVLE